MQNELMVLFSGGNYIYRKTHKHTVKTALTEFFQVCSDHDMNFDNMKLEGAVLRDENYNTIDEIRS